MGSPLRSLSRLSGRSRVVEGEKKDGTIFPIRLAVSELHVGEEKFYCGLVEELEVASLISSHLSRVQMTEARNSLGRACAGSIVPGDDQLEGNYPFGQREDDEAVWVS